MTCKFAVQAVQECSSVSPRTRSQEVGLQLCCAGNIFLLLCYLYSKQGVELGKCASPTPAGCTILVCKLPVLGEPRVYDFSTSLHPHMSCRPCSLLTLLNAENWQNSSGSVHSTGRLLCVRLHRVLNFQDRVCTKWTRQRKRGGYMPREGVSGTEGARGGYMGQHEVQECAHGDLKPTPCSIPLHSSSPLNSSRRYDL